MRSLMLRAQDRDPEAYGQLVRRFQDMAYGYAYAILGDYRRRGYAKTCVSALVEHFTSRGGAACYGCSPDNAASVATARSVGFTLYGKGLILSAPRSER